MKTKVVFLLTFAIILPYQFFMAKLDDCISESVFRDIVKLISEIEELTKPK